MPCPSCSRRGHSRASAPLCSRRSATGLTILGGVFSPSGVDLSLSVTNRAMGIFVLWALAGSLVARARIRDRLIRSEQTLQRERDFSSAALDSLPGVFTATTRIGSSGAGTRTSSASAATPARRSRGCVHSTFLPACRRTCWRRGSRKSSTMGPRRWKRTSCPRDGTRTPFYFTGLTTMIEGRRHLLGAAPCGGGVAGSSRPADENGRDLAGNRLLHSPRSGR